MNTGSLGTFVISWSQTEIDGVQSAPLSLLNVGATWRYSGAVVRVDRPQDVLMLQGADGAADMRKRAARTVRRNADWTTTTALFEANMAVAPGNAKIAESAAKLLLLRAEAREATDVGRFV